MDAENNVIDPLEGSFREITPQTDEDTLLCDICDKRYRTVIT